MTGGGGSSGGGRSSAREVLAVVAASGGSSLRPMHCALPVRCILITLHSTVDSLEGTLSAVSHLVADKTPHCLSPAFDFPQAFGE